MSEYSYNADANSFQSLVVEQSHRVPVVVDFWAAWCAPCRVLMPVLMKLVDEYAGGFILVKVNTDEQQDLAARYGIRSLPTVALFRNGEMVDQFLGAQPESVIRAMVDRYVVRASDAKIDQAMSQRGAGNLESAVNLLREAVIEDPRNDRAKLMLAEALIDLGELNAAQQAIDNASIEIQTSADAKALAARLEFARIAADAAPITELERAVRDNPRDLDSRYRLAARMVLGERLQEALDQLLEIVRCDRQYREDAARRAVLRVFDLLGGKGELVTRYRGLLARAIH